jgi:hypothetical protein
LELNGGVMAAELATLKVKTTREGEEQRHEYCNNNNHMYINIHHWFITVCVYTVCTFFRAVART